MSSSWTSKVSGFFRFYGQRVVDALRRVYGSRKERTPLQRSFAFLTVVLVAVGVYAGWTGSLLRRPAIHSEFADRLDDSGSSTLSELPLGAPFSDGATAAGEGWAANTAESDPSDPVAQVPDDATFALAFDPRTPAPASGGDDRVSVVLPSQLETTESLSTDPAEAATAPSAESSAEDNTARSIASPASASSSPSTPGRASLPPVSITSMVLPVSGEVLQPYGWHRHPVFGEWRHSSSVVLEPSEDGLVRAALAGRVRDVVYEGGLWRVHIDHAGGWQTEYAGLLEVSVGSYQVVDTGQVIGSLDPQAGWGVSFAVRQGEVAVNPLSLIDEGAVPATTR